MQKKIAIADFLTKMKKKGYDLIDIFFYGEEGFTFELENLKTKTICFEGNNIVLTDNPMNECTKRICSSWMDRSMLIKSMIDAGYDKHPELITEDILKDLLGVHRTNQICLKTDDMGRIRILIN